MIFVHLFWEMTHEVYFLYIFRHRYLIIFLKIGSLNVTTRMDDFESRLYAQTH